jgi:hypothetical protein
MFKRLWIQFGGLIVEVRGTGEVRYIQPLRPHCVRANDRRHDVPAVLISRINQIIKMKAANDESFDWIDNFRKPPN